VSKDDTKVDAIPAVLRDLPQWVVWKSQDRGNGPTKVPYNANSGKPAKTTDPEDWTSFERSLASFDKGDWSGVGFVFAKDGGLVGVDLDDCIGDDGRLCQQARAIVDQLASYTENSPSGRGVKIWVRGSLPIDKSGKKTIADGFGGIEFYQHSRYFTVTGQHLAGTPRTVESRQAELTVAFRRYFPLPKQSTTTMDTTSRAVDRCQKYIQKMPDAISGQGGHDVTFQAACECFRFGLSDADAMSVLHWFNAAKCQPPWRDDELLHKLDSARETVESDGDRGIRIAHHDERKTIPAENQATPLDGSSSDERKINWYTIPEVGKLPRFLKGMPVFSTGFDGLDRVLMGGFRAQCVYVLAGRTGSAKSTVALNIARRVAINGDSVLVFKLEESVIEAVYRIQSATAQSSIKDLLDGPELLFGDTREKMLDAWQLIQDLPIRVADHRDIHDIERLTRAHAEDGGKLVCIDQLSMIDVPGSEFGYQRATEASNRLRRLASESGVAILLVSQVNRPASKGSAPLSCHDLRDSGALENDAAAVILIDKSDSTEGVSYSGSEPVTTLTVLVDKNRYGPRTDHKKPVQFCCWPAQCRIEDFDEGVIE
jgi:KaiC/GvpD/RAD55 family RecA-like ATPase